MAMTQEQNVLTLPQRPTSSVIWIYACGQLGWSLVVYGVSALLNYFYLPPENAAAKTTFPNFIPTISIMGLTLLGIIGFGGRLFDAFIDPFVANWSDKTQSRFGKRKIFLAIAALPLAATSFLIFYPITEGASTANVVWLTANIFLFYISLAAYMIPFAALISELGHHPDDRLKISTTLSITWALGYLIGNTIPAMKVFFEKHGDPSVWAFQKSIGICAIVSAVFLLIPVFFLNEKSTPCKAIIKALFSSHSNQFFNIARFDTLFYPIWSIGWH